MRSNTPEKDYEAPHALPIETLPEPDGEARSPLETAIRHKFDRRILPLGILIYLVAQIDRSNMSNAVVLGLIEDTNLTGNRFNVALTLFFVTYILFEIPANLMCKYFGPRFWLSFITFGFGITTMCISFVKTYPALVVCRLLLGVFEAGELSHISSFQVHRHLSSAAALAWSAGNLTNCNNDVINRRATGPDVHLLSILSAS